MGKVGTLKRLVVALGATTAVLIAAAVSGAAPAPVDVKVYDQCANGDPPSTSTSCPSGWINGILQASNSHYAEDEVTPQRLVLELEKNSAITGRTVEISYLTRKGGVHAYDSLATWNYTQTSADHCQDLPGSVPCPGGSATTFPIPLDPTVVADANGAGGATSSHQLTGQVFTMYGGTITSVSSYTHDDAAGSSDSYAHVTITYSVPSTASGPQVMLLFGGHLAPSLGPRGWGVGVGSSSISGGPYHIRVTGADGGSVGSRDNQIMSGAILAPANILIKKVAVGGNGTFDYTATGGISSGFSIATSGGTGSQSFTNISAGAYTVTESGPPAGWDFTNLVCVDEDNGSSVDLVNRKANIDLDPGETVTCTYTNTKRANIIIDKVTNPAGDPQSFPFTLTGGPDSLNQAFGLTDAATPHDSGSVKPGTYSASESVPAGWDLTSATCSDGSSPSSIALAAGETVTCTFNNAKRGTIIVDKITVPPNDPQSFSFSLTGGPDGINQGFSLTHAATPHDSGLIKPGTYAASETVPGGWALTGSTCSDGSLPGAISLAAGETVTCTFTNTKQATVIVKKVMIGGTDTFTYTGTPAGDISSNNGTISASVNPGSYSSVEGTKPGWTLSSISCDDANSSGNVGTRTASFNVVAGETVTCTFTNTKQATVIVKKVMVGGTDTFNYTGTPSGPISANNGTISSSVNPGSYSSIEDAKAGWSLTSISCDDANSSGNIGTRTASFNVEAGETVTCTFTNTKQGQVIVKKVMVGGTDTFNYSGTPNGAISSNNGTISQAVAPGPYVSTEAAKAGWDLTGVVCDDGNSTGSVANRQATFNVEAGETVTCTFTNTKQGQVVVKKVMVGGTDTFNYSGTPNGAISVNNGTISQAVAPGPYSSTEAAKAGWDLTSIVCDDGNSTGSVVNRQASFNVEAGETVTCTFTNEKDAGITVQKLTNPPGDPQAFSFNASYDADGFSLTHGQSNNSGDLDPGTYAVSETVPAGWDLDSAVCSDGSAPGAINLAAGESVTCIFTNEKDANIVVKKETNPDGDPQSFGFSANYDANGFSLTDGQQDDSGDLDPGTYSVSENVPAGWDLESAVCSDGSAPGSIGLAAGETVTCTFTNEKDAVIIVQKQTDPDGSPQSFSFTANYDGDGFSLSDGQSNNSGDLDPGTYSVSENVPAGWDLESAVCSDQSAPGSIGLAAGETVTCVFSNRLRRGAIIIQKQTNPDNDPQLFAFSASYDGDGFSLSDGQSNNSGALLPGSYSVSETVPAGWDLDSASCDDGSAPGSIGLAAGETVTCVFTNEKDAAIIVEKQTNPNGDPQSFTFNADYDENGFSLSDGQSNNSGDLDPGTYSVSENVPQGWDLESAECSDESNASSIALAAGETVTCVFTNEKDAAIIVEKQTNPNADPQVFGFTANYDGDGFSLGDGQSNNSGDLDPGTYSVSENVPAGWDLASAVCSDESAPGSIGLAAGETVTCVFTNTKRGTIIVEKQTSPNGAAGSFGFSGTAAGSIGDNGQIVVGNLVPGTYTSTEAAADGWSLTSISCNDANSTGSLGSRTATFRLEAGETVKCTFANAKLGQGSIDVQKSVTPTSVKEPGGQVTYSVRITNTSADVDVAITNVVDDKFGDLDDDGGSGCFDVPINLAPGQFASCQFTKQITGAGGTSHVNVVTASGTDEAGNPVSDSDDARVDITPRLIDLVIVKEASSPTPLNGIVNYSMTVMNKGPDTATNVQLADPAPAGITYLTANPSQGTCNVSPALITCSLGSIAAGQTVTIAITGRATSVGSHTNTATVTGGGGRETNPADNVDSAVTIVPAPLRPPTVKPSPAPAVCLSLTVSPKMIKADGKPDKVTAKVTAGKKRVKGVKVVVSGAGVSKAAKTNGKGVAVLRINPKKPGLITVTVSETNQKLCGPKRIGVVGVFLPPLTG